MNENELQALCDFIMTYKGKETSEDVENILKIKKIDDELKKGVLVEDEFDGAYRSVYIGTVCEMLPSGKYYTPFAASNVEACEACNGEGTIKAKVCEACGGLCSVEAYADEIWNARVDYELDTIGASIQVDGSDMYVVRMVEDNSATEKENENE